MNWLVLSNAQWSCISGLIIGRPNQHGSTGGDNRTFGEGALWIVRTGSHGVICLEARIVVL